MRPHPRIRKTIKWGGVVVTVLLLIAWPGNTRYWAGCGSSYWTLVVQEGTLHYTRVYAPAREQFFWNACGNSEDVPFIYRPLWGAFGSGWSVVIPLWMPPAVCLTVTVTAWRLDTLARRRAKLDLCPKCGYDRVGIAKDAKCPECGAAPVDV